MMFDKQIFSLLIVVSLVDYGTAQYNTSCSVIPSPIFQYYSELVKYITAGDIFEVSCYKACNYKRHVSLRVIPTANIRPDYNFRPIYTSENIVHHQLNVTFEEDSNNCTQCCTTGINYSSYTFRVHTSRTLHVQSHVLLISCGQNIIVSENGEETPEHSPTSIVVFINANDTDSTSTEIPNTGSFISEAGAIGLLTTFIIVILVVAPILIILTVVCVCLWIRLHQLRQTHPS